MKTPNEIIRENFKVNGDGKIRTEHPISQSVIAEMMIGYANEKHSFLSNVTTRNWFEKLPLHWKLAYHLIGGIIIGYLLHYV